MKIHDSFARKLSDELNLDKEQYEIISYGIFALVQIIISIAAVAFFGFLFGVIVQALVVSFSTSILRQFSGGVHAGKPTVCLIIGTAISVLVAVIIKISSVYMMFAHFVFIMFISYSICFYIIYKYAPVDSPAKPITKAAKRKKLKKISFFIVTSYFIISIIFIASYLYTHNMTYLIYMLDICGGMLFQVFSLTIIGHRILSLFDSGITKVLFGR